MVDVVLLNSLLELSSFLSLLRELLIKAMLCFYVLRSHALRVSFRKTNIYICLQESKSLGHVINASFRILATSTQVVRALSVFLFSKCIKLAQRALSLGTILSL